MFPLGELRTTDGRRVEVVSVGRHNFDAGPDFIGARVSIDGVMWAGNVEIHERSSDWFRHHHDRDAAYDGVVLHVAEVVDVDVVTASGQRPPQLQLSVPAEVVHNYDTLVAADRHPRCRAVLGQMPRLTVTSWLSALCVERMEQRMNQLMERRERCGLGWEETLWVTVARNFGFGKNGDTFEHWAMTLPTTAMSKHRDNLFQIEALFFGVAGLLEDDMDVDVEYYRRLQGEWRYLRRKFTLDHLNRSEWTFMRMRPQNFPYTRLAQLAVMYHEGHFCLSRILEATTVEELMQVLDTSVTMFWQTHHTFSSAPTARRDGRLSVASKQLLILNSVVPMLFAYGRYRSDEQLVERAMALMEQLPAESNYIVREWRDAGVVCRSAADTQALYWLSTHYCDAKDCLRCRFGYEYMRHNPGFLWETDEGEGGAGGSADL